MLPLWTLGSYRSGSQCPAGLKVSKAPYTKILKDENLWKDLFEMFSMTSQHPVLNHPLFPLLSHFERTIRLCCLHCHEWDQEWVVIMSLPQPQPLLLLLLLLRRQVPQLIFSHSRNKQQLFYTTGANLINKIWQKIMKRQHLEIFRSGEGPALHRGNVCAFNPAVPGSTPLTAGVIFYFPTIVSLEGHSQRKWNSTKW